MWMNLPELLLRMESVGRWRLSLHWRGRADLRWRCRTSSDWCPPSLIRNVIWLKWLEIACICSKFIYFEVKWHYCSLQMWLSKIFHHMKKDSGENKKLVGLGSGRGGRTRGKVIIKCDLYCALWIAIWISRTGDSRTGPRPSPREFRGGDQMM